MRCRSEVQRKPQIGHLKPRHVLTVGTTATRELQVQAPAAGGGAIGGSAAAASPAGAGADDRTARRTERQSRGTSMTVTATTVPLIGRRLPGWLAGQRPITVAGFFTAVGAGEASTRALAPQLSWALFGASLMLTLALCVKGVWRLRQHRDPPPPEPPEYRQARRRAVAPEPPRQIYEFASHCVICGRPLTNPYSMRARVGSTCIQRYGPRYKMIANPQHAVWTKAVAAAVAEQRAEQGRLDKAHQPRMRHHENQVRLWKIELDTPEGRARRQMRQAGRHLLLSGAAGSLGLTAGAATTLALL